MNVNVKSLIALGALSVLASACGAGAGSCTTSAVGLSFCINYTGSSYSAEKVKQECTGAYSAGPCESSSGKQCVVQKGTSTESHYVFGGGASAAAQLFCTTVGGVME